MYNFIREATVISGPIVEVHVDSIEENLCIIIPSLSIKFVPMEYSLIFKRIPFAVRLNFTIGYE